MPRLPAAPSCIRLRLIGVRRGEPWNNVQFLRYAGGTPDVAALNTLAGTISSAWTTNFAPVHDTGVQLVTVELTDLTSPTSAQGVWAGSVAGTLAGSSPLPNSVATVISWKIQRHYRGGHPRSYLCAPWALQVPAGILLDGTYRTNVLTAARAWRTAMNGLSSAGITYTFVSVSYYDQKALRAQGIPFDITDAQVHTRADSQRGRMGKETA